MRCEKCSHLFCWDCKSSLLNKPHNNLLCLAKNFLKLTLILSPVLLAYLKADVFRFIGKIKVLPRMKRSTNLPLPVDFIKRSASKTLALIGFILRITTYHMPFIYMKKLLIELINKVSSFNSKDKDRYLSIILLPNM